MRLERWQHLGRFIVFAASVVAIAAIPADAAAIAAPPPTPEELEIERRLALPPFAYVAEAEYDAAGARPGEIEYSGAAAIVDSQTDSLVARPAGGTSLQGVAVAPDGTRFFMTDAHQPVLHVFDAETQVEIDQIDLPGVAPHDPMWMVEALKDGTASFPYSMMRTCASSVACTPDGLTVLVASSAGLQVVDLLAGRVVRTFPEFKGGPVAVSFDGKRAYVADDNLDDIAPRGLVDWLGVIMETEACRVVCLDLATGRIVAETQTAAVAGLAIKPDDSQVFISETYRKRVRVLDSLTLEDRWAVSTEPSYSVGIGFVPNGTKAYVVCSADNEFASVITGSRPVSDLPQAEDYFCAVVDTGREEIVKRIPLEAY